MASAFPDAPAAEAEILALWVFDMVVAIRLRWPRPVAPKLRSKAAAKIVDLLLAEDCLAPAEAARQAPMTDLAARRLFDRLLALGAVRELSGRPSFRLYGL